MASPKLLLRPPSYLTDLEPFRARVETHSPDGKVLVSDIVSVGARRFVQYMKSAGRGVTRITWLRSEQPCCACGNPLLLDEHVCPVCAELNFARLVAANQKDAAA